MSIAVATNNNQNDIFEFFNKGLSFSTGVGAELDLVEAHKFFNLAALNGNSEAKERRRELSQVMTEIQISAAQRAARDWLNRAAN